MDFESDGFGKKTMDLATNIVESLARCTYGPIFSKIGISVYQSYAEEENRKR